MNKNNFNNNSEKKAYVKPAMVSYDIKPGSLLQSSVRGYGMDYGGPGEDEYGD